MKKQIIILTDDYWHHSDTIEPMIPLLFNDDYEIISTKDPKILLDHNPILFISFKDPIENDQIPTPIWCNEEWTNDLENKINEGMGFLDIHAGVTDIPEEHRMTKHIIRSRFINHPKKCPVSFEPRGEHPILKGIESFTFPMNDEHYIMDFNDKEPTTILGYTTSIHGEQPGLWIHEMGKGRVCCITPGHYTKNLTYQPYLQLIKNAIAWCIKEI